MQKARAWTSRQGTVVVLAAVVCMRCHDGSQTLSAQVSPLAKPAYSAMAANIGAIPSGMSTIDLAKRDPNAFLQTCLQNYRDSNVRDYACKFTMRERLGRRLTKPQHIDVRFRESPFSVDMRWTKNPVQANRALYVKGAWRDRAGRDLAWFKPSGVIIRLIVPKIQERLDGARVKKSSRRGVGQFGFRNTLELIARYNDKGLRNGVLDLSFVGTGAVEGRPTFVFERILPFTGDEEPYPDALLRYHIDQEWLVPTACYSYADTAGDVLLGSYVISDVRFNVGLTDDDFAPEKIGF